MGFKVKHLATICLFETLLHTCIDRCRISTNYKKAKIDQKKRLGSNLFKAVTLHSTLAKDAKAFNTQGPGHHVQSPVVCYNAYCAVQFTGAIFS